MNDIIQRVIANTPLTDGEQQALMLVILLLIIAYFVVKMIPVKRVNPWTKQNVRNKHRKKTPPPSKDGER